MKGSQKVIDCLNELLAGELMARDQYFIHSEMYKDWGYEKLYTRIHHEMGDETEHSRQFIARILLLEGTPKMVPEALSIGHDVPSMLKADLDIELKVRDNLKKGIVLCEQENDFVTRKLLVEQLLDTEEDHAYWLEQQLRLIDEMGLQNYLQSSAA
ncbi:bacterioferritin [Neisseriaceae bacterium PsAf]|nr:bacterioferritin [Neisseriaceae bacterium PsAf]MCV2502589.1 bacterioferritin [Neisseriaceae bacterium]